MKNTTNTRLNVCRSISALQLVSLSLGMFLVAAVPMTASAQKETPTVNKPVSRQPVRGNDKLVVKSALHTDVRPIIKQSAHGDGKPIIKSGQVTDVRLVSRQFVHGEEKPAFGRGREIAIRPIDHQLLRREEAPVFLRGRENAFRPMNELAVFSTNLILIGLVTLPQAPAAIPAASAQDVVDFKLALIAADIQNLKDRIKDRQQREQDITNGNVPDANPQQVPSMQAMDKSDQNQINNLSAEAAAIPKMGPKAQLKIARANFNSHISDLKRNKKALQDRVNRLQKLPSSDGTDKAIADLNGQIDQDDQDINTLTGMSNQATALLK